MPTNTHIVNYSRFGESTAYKVYCHGQDDLWAMLYRLRRGNYILVSVEAL